MHKFLFSIIASTIISFSCFAQNEIRCILEGRHVNKASLVAPVSDGIQESGRVVVKIWVNQYGKVSRAEPGADGTTITNAKLWAACRAAAMSAVFELRAEAPSLQEGLIIYPFPEITPKETAHNDISQITVKEIVENPRPGRFRVSGHYYETFDYKNLLLSIEEEQYVIPVRLVKKDLGAENRFRSLNLNKKDIITIEGDIERISVNYEYFYGLTDAVIVDVVKSVSPSFNGGDLNTFSEWVNSRLNYPQVAKENGLQGRVLLSFTIKSDGRLTDIKVVRGVDPVLDKEAVRVVSMSPRWKPGLSNGEPIDYTFSFPVIFQLR